jgi:hypothetical protein
MAEPDHLANVFYLFQVPENSYQEVDLPFRQHKGSQGSKFVLQLFICGGISRVALWAFYKG